MNPKPISINPTVTHRVQPMGFVKVAVASGLLMAGVITLAYDQKATEYKPPVAVPNVIPSVYEVKDLQITSPTSGKAVIKLDGYTLKFDFFYEAHPDSFGVPGLDFTAVEINQLGEISITSPNGSSFGDFTDYNDHRNINQLLAGYIERNRLVEAN